MLAPLKAKKSPLDINSVSLNLSADEIISSIHEGRKFVGSPKCVVICGKISTNGFVIVMNKEPYRPNMVIEFF